MFTFVETRLFSRIVSEYLSDDELADLQVAGRGGVPASGRSAEASSRANRSIGGSPVVPCTLTSATSRVQASRCASSSDQLRKRRPAIALDLT